jgi:hypothetical protein
MLWITLHNHKVVVNYSHLDMMNNKHKLNYMNKYQEQKQKQKMDEYSFIYWYERKFTILEIEGQKLKCANSGVCQDRDKGSSTVTDFRVWLPCFCMAWHMRDQGGTTVTGF